MLDTKIFDRADENASKCDLMLCLGSTLQVTPANELVELIKDPQRYVICNRQVTDKDKDCLGTDSTGNVLGSRVFGDCDTLFREIMKLMYKSEELVTWENERSERTRRYDAERTTD